MRAVRRTGRLAARLSAAAALLTLLAGIPAALWHYIGWPLPSTLPGSPAGWEQVLTGPFPDTAVANLLAVALWLVWAAFGYSVVLEWSAARTGRTARRLPVIAPVQAVAAMLVAALSAGPVALAAGPAPAAPPAVVQVQPGVAAGAPTTATHGWWASPTATAAPTGTERLPPPAMAGPAAITVDGTRPPRFAAAGFDGPLLVQVGDQRYTVTVRRNDTLWNLAGTWLGDPHRWPEIYHLNRDRYDAHGRMGHGNHIEPGWALILPADATPPNGSRPATPPPPAPTTPPPSAPPSTTPTPSASAPGATTPDDGVVVPPPPTPTGTGSATASPSPTGNEAPPSRSPHADPPGVALPGGSWVDLGLAAAIAATAALVWIHRRRRYTPRRPSPALRLDDPALAPLPPVVRRIRRGVRDSAPAAEIRPEHNHAADRPTGPAGEPDPPPPPVTPALSHPLSALWPPAGLGLVGPGADAAGRGFLVAALTGGGPDEPPARSRVVVAATTLATLLGAHAVDVADTPRLTITAGLPEALEILETATLHRTRLVYDHEVDTVAALRDDDPVDEAVPPLLLIADATTAAHQRARIAAVLTQGQRLDIHGVLLGAWADGDTVHVAADGTTRPADPDASRHGTHPADVTRLAVLNPTETADLLRTFAEAHTGQTRPAPPVEQPPVNRPPGPAPGRAPDDEKAADAGPDRADQPPRTPQDAERGEGVHPSTGVPTTATGASGPNGAVHRDDLTKPSDDVGTGETGAAPASDPGPVRVGPGSPDTSRPTDDAATPDNTRPGTAATRPVRVVLLGEPCIVDVPPPQPGDPPLRPQAIELLVYLAAVGGAADRDRILEDLLGDVPRSRAPHRLNTYVYSLRTNLKRVGGKATYVAPPEQRYALNRDALDIDLWRMQTAIADANTATDPATRTTALRRAVACYTGPLAQDRDYEWVEPYREAVRQQALDAHLALAAALADEHPHDAVTVLSAAIGHDPYTEPLYQQAMRLHARLRDVEAIRGLRRTLTRRLAEIDAEPGDDTLALADQLVTDLQRRPREPRPLRGDAA